MDAAARETNAACWRTAKSCGSDAPMLASSLREEAQMTVSNKPGHRGEREVSRKTIARGMPGETGVTVVTMLVCFVLFRTRGFGRIERPAFPAPSVFFGPKDSRIARTHRAARSWSRDVKPSSPRNGFAVVAGGASLAVHMHR